jgi:hypothetical protein
VTVEISEGMSCCCSSKIWKNENMCDRARNWIQIDGYEDREAIEEEQGKKPSLEI